MNIRLLLTPVTGNYRVAHRTADGESGMVRGNAIAVHDWSTECFQESGASGNKEGPDGRENSVAVTASRVVHGDRFLTVAALYSPLFFERLDDSATQLL